MSNSTRFYIDGAWIEPAVPHRYDLVDPTTEGLSGEISLGSAEDVDKAVAAARRAFPLYSQTSREERLALFERIIALMEERSEDLARIVTLEIGCAISLSRKLQTAKAVANFRELAFILETYDFETPMGGALVRREPIGVCGIITPWNWPLMPITAKVAAALAAGCTVVVKPSEYASRSAIALAEIFHDAGVPKGVFNLVNGDGPIVGHAMASHPDIDKLTFTGSVPAGVMVARAAAANVKRVTQELGGKSANIILPDADIGEAVPSGVRRCFSNAGQSCQAPSRMLVHRSFRDAAIKLATEAVASVRVGVPLDPATTMGPLATRAQFDKVQSMIAQGIDEGATLVAGGLGRPEGFSAGYYVRPTVFADVTPQMTIAREEVFGPVLSIIAYDTEEEAVNIANDTVFGLAAYVQGKDREAVRRVAMRMRAGRVYLGSGSVNGKDDRAAPFGGYKQSGNGRERGVFGLEDCLEVKAIMNYHDMMEEYG